MLAAWKAGKRFLPLSTNHPMNELQYFVNDSNTGLIVHSVGGNDAPHYVGKEQIMLNNLGVATMDVTKQSSSGILSINHPLQPDDGALILYTSGTTGKNNQT